MNSRPKPAFHNDGVSLRMRRYLTVSIIGLTAIGMGWLFRNMLPTRVDFYNNLWGPVHLLVHGQSPYDTASLSPTLLAMWFPMAIGFFFPLGWLPATLATQVWFVFNILALWIFILWAVGEKGSPLLLPVLALFCFLFPPVLTHLYLGQISITVTLSLLLAAHYMRGQKHWLGAASVALALTKPHLAFLAVLGLCVYEYRLGGWKVAAGFAGRVAVMAAAFCIPLFIAEPTWIPDALASISQNPHWAYPSLFEMYQRYFPGWHYLLWGVTFLIVVGANVLLWIRLSPRDAMLWSLALAPLASPFVWSWDFVVMLPLFLFSFVASNLKNRIVLAIGYGIALAGMILVQFKTGSNNQVFWWVPVWFVALIGFAAFRKKTVAATSP